MITCESQEDVITVPIPAEGKPLSCSISTKAGAATGLLASFYDPEAHTWVVKHAPVDVGFVTVTVKVLTLMDPFNRYELYVAATSAERGADVDELFELRRRSFAYRTARETRPEEGPHGPRRRAWPPVGLERPKYPRDLVCLCAPLPLLAGYVLVGGGFVSDYPVHSTGPSMPIVTARFFDCAMGDDALFFAAVATEEGGPSADPMLLYDVLKPNDAKPAVRHGKVEPEPEELEYSAWSVTAAPNAALACFSIGLRSRDVQRTTAGVTRWLLDKSAFAGETNFAPSQLSALPSPPQRRLDTSRRTTTPRRGSRPGAHSAASPSGQAVLVSPSRFSSPDSEARSSLDSTLAASATEDHAMPRSAQQRPRTAGGATPRAVTTLLLPSSIAPDTTAPLERRSTGGELQQRRVPQFLGELFDSDEITQELQVRKSLTRMVALRKLISVSHRTLTHVMDLELPPPHGRLRVRFGMCKETRASAELFYR